MISILSFPLEPWGSSHAPEMQYCSFFILHLTFSSAKWFFCNQAGSNVLSKTLKIMQILSKVICQTYFKVKYLCFLCEPCLMANPHLVREVCRWEPHRSPQHSCLLGCCWAVFVQLLSCWATMVAVTCCTKALRTKHQEITARQTSKRHLSQSRGWCKTAPCTESCFWILF